MAGKRRRYGYGRKRRPSRRAGRKTYKRRRTLRSRAPIGWKPFGNSRVARLTYCDTFPLDPGANTVASRIFRANGLFDPDVALGGHQPYGFDQLMAVYNSFCVLGAKITVMPIPDSSFTSYGIAVKLSDQASLLSTSPTTLQEQAGYRYRMYMNGSAAPSPRVIATYSARKILRPGFMYNDKYQGTVNTDPSDQWFFHVVLYSPVPVANPAAMQVNVRIDYIARFTSPAELNAS